MDELLAQAAHEVSLAIMDKYPDDREYDVTFSKSFEKKMEKVIRRANHFVAYKVLRRVACILIALFAAATMFLAINTEARAAVVDWIKETFGEFYHYFFTGEQEQKEPEMYSLDWVPEGYVIKGSYEVDNVKYMIYSNTSGNMIHYHRLC